MFLNELLNRKNKFHGRGALALITALKAIAWRDGFTGEAILPTMVCHAVLEAVLAGGYTPRFADIDPHRYAITPQTVAPLINRNTHVLIVAHLFGYAAPIEELEEMAHALNIRLIEDAVQGIGGLSPNGRALGSFGDFSFISFANSKILAGQGAGLYFDDLEWEKYIADAEASIPSIRSDEATTQFSEVALRDLYHGVGQSVRLGLIEPQQAGQMFGLNLKRYETLLYASINSDANNVRTMEQSIASLETRVKSRNKRSQDFSKFLSAFNVNIPPLLPGDAVWRYSFHFQNLTTTNQFIVEFRSRGGIVSTLYYPLHKLYPTNDPAPQSDKIFSSLVNLWVDERSDYQYFQILKDTILSLMLD